MTAIETPTSIKTFAVLDLETNGLPSEQFNKCSITELCIYAFSAQHLKNNLQREQAVLGPLQGMEGLESLEFNAPNLPRCLHKLTLMVNPQRMIAPAAERVTGLSNDMLCTEAPFNKNSANCLLAFLDRLEKPICLVAHNGWTFDFPVIRHVLEKLQMTLPPSILCVDSLKAFIEIDEKQQLLENVTIMQMDAFKSEKHNKYEEITALSDPLDECVSIDWQKLNETTPKRKPQALKRRHENAHKRLEGFKVRRELFSLPFQPASKYPPKDVYKLGNIYERIFKQKPKDLHRAESDVLILTKIILHYGLDFLAYAEERKQSFACVLQLGKC